MDPQDFDFLDLDPAPKKYPYPGSFFFSEDPGSGFGAAAKLNGSEALSTEKKTKINLK